MYKHVLFGLTRSQQGLKQQKDMLIAAARLHSKLQDQKTTNQVLNLSTSKKKKFLRDGMVTQMHELGYKATFSQKYFTLYRTYVLYEDMYYYFVDKFSREDASMGEIILTITRLADKYLEHEFDKKGYANIFDFLKEKHHIEDMLRDHVLNDYLSDRSEEKIDPHEVSTGVFKVYVDDNFHYMDESERYTYGEYGTYEEAVDACKVIVDEEIEAFKNTDSNMGVYGQHCLFGEDPWVMPVPEGKKSFSARDYVYQKCKKNTEPTKNSESHKDSKQDLLNKIRQSLKMTPQEQKQLIEEHTFEEMENEEQGIYTRWELKRAINGYAAEVENKLDDGKINWDYVAADASIVYGDEIDTDVIYEVLEEVAHDIDPDRVSYIKFLKKKNP